MSIDFEDKLVPSESKSDNNQLQQTFASNIPHGGSAVIHYTYSWFMEVCYWFSVSFPAYEAFRKRN